MRFDEVDGELSNVPLDDHYRKILDFVVYQLRKNLNEATESWYAAEERATVAERKVVKLERRVVELEHQSPIKAALRMCNRWIERIRSNLK